MSLEIRFTPEAEETYDLIVTQLRERWGNKYVIKFEDKISKILGIIAKSPLIYPVAKENAETRKCILHENCSMYYRVIDNYIDVVYFWDNRQDPLITLNG